jgi:membrane protein DedA with SNARE-associated domain
VTHLVLTWGYFALFIATVLAAMGIPTGSEIVIAYAGALASGHISGSTHHLNVIAVIIIATIGELIGSFLGYSIGRLGGRPLVERLGRFVLITNADLDRAERLFERHGEPVVFFGRFIPLVRSFVGIAAGLAEMTVAKFAIFTAFAAAIWCSAFAILGDGLGANWDSVLKRVSDAGYVIAALVVLAVVMLFVHRIKAVRGARNHSGSAAPRALSSDLDGTGLESGTTNPPGSQRTPGAVLSPVRAIATPLDPERYPTVTRLLTMLKIDFAPRHRQPPAVLVVLATAISVLGSLAADAVLVAIGTHIFPSTAGYVHFRFADYARLTTVGVLIACAAWPIVTRISSNPRWVFVRMAVLVTLVLLVPDLYLFVKGGPPKAVTVLIWMHLAIAVITYNVVVRLAPVKLRRSGSGTTSRPR